MNLSLDAAALAWTLVHSLWQAAGVALLVWALLAVLPAQRAGRGTRWRRRACSRWWGWRWRRTRP